MELEKVKSVSEFTLLNKQGVKSDQGFEVQMVNRHCIEYREGDLVLSIEVEMGKGALCRARLSCFVKEPSYPQSPGANDP